MANDKTTKDRRTIGIQITPPPLDAAGLEVLAELEAGGGRADVTPVISRLVRAELRRIGLGRAQLRAITLLPAGVATDARARREVYAVRIRKAIAAHVPEAPPREPPPDQLAAWCPACRVYLPGPVCGSCGTCKTEVELHDRARLRKRIAEVSADLVRLRAAAGDVERRLRGYGPGGSSPPASLLREETDTRSEIRELERVQLQIAHVLGGWATRGLAPVLAERAAHVATVIGDMHGRVQAGVDPAVILAKMFAELGIDLTPAGRELAASADRPTK